MKSPATGTWELQTTKNGTYLVKIKSKEVLGETSGVVKLQVKNPKIAASQLWIKGTVYMLGQWDSTLKTVTVVYVVTAGFPCNIYGKGL